jgi:PAS domain S-box-containing protein
MKERIFIVEDEAIVAMTLSDQLSYFGYNVCGHAAYAEKAQHMIPGLEPDLVLMDIRLAGKMDGIELASILRAQHGIGVVFMTAYTDEATLAKTEQAGAFAYLVKPIESSSLRATIRLALQKHKAEKELRSALRKIEEQSRELQRSEALYRGIIDFASDAIITMGDKSTIVSFNGAAEKLFGYSSHEIVGQSLDLLIPAGLRARHGAVVAEFSTENCLGRPMRHMGNMTCQRRDGSVFPSEIAISKVVTADRILYTAIVRDLTERIETEQKIANQNILIRNAQRLAKMGSWEWDIVNNRVTGTGEMHRLLGTDSEIYQVHGVDAHIQLVHSDDRAHVTEAIRRCVQEGSPLDIEYRIIAPNGELHYLHGLGTVVLDDAGRAVRISGSLQDITERKKTEQELRQLNEKLEVRVNERTAELQAAKDLAESASRAKTHFLANMSHELRNPLSAILGFADMLHSSSLSPEQQGQVADIQRAGGHLKTLIDDLLDLARIESGRPRVELEPLSLRQAFADAKTLASASLLAQRIQFSCQLGSDLPVRADGGRLRQVLVNLLSNAAKYTHEGGHVTLSACRLTDDLVRISVTDDGIGIPPHKLKDLFVPFERLGAEKTKIEGDGIGLALSYKLVELMGGRLGVESIPGQATTFYLDLPAATGSPASVAAARADVPTSPERLRVLYIEDDPINRRLMHAALGKQGTIALRCAQSGAEGLALAEAEPPDLILIDMHLDDMDGFAVMKALRSRSHLATIPVIAVSASAQESEVQRALSAGFLRYLTKPFPLSDLGSILLQSARPA